MGTPTEHSIIVTDQDLERLQSMLDQYATPEAETLEAELGRARVVSPSELPPQVATMDSVLVYEDCGTGTRRTIQLVYPHQADAAEGRVSVLAPIGSALLGLEVGQVIAWKVPNGFKRIRLVEVSYQPEAAGDSHR